MALRYEAATSVGVFILLGFIRVGSKLPPAITYPNQENPRQLFILASPSNDVILNCDATDADPNKDFVWRRNQTHPLPSGWRPTNAIQGKGQSSPTAPFPAKSITLPAADIPSDPSSLEGSYECVVSNTAGVAVSGPVSITFVRVVYPKDPEFQDIEGPRGSTLKIPCSNGEPPLRFYPSASAIGIQFEWSTAVMDVGNKVAIAPYPHQDDDRIIMNELGTLYIRNLSTKEMMADDSSLRCTIFNPMAAGDGRTVVGRYLMGYSAGRMEPFAAKLLYKTPDFNVTEGASFYIYCVYEDAGGNFARPVFLTPGTAPFTLVNGGIYVMNVTERDSGNYTCRYRSESATLDAVTRVIVMPYPLTEEIADIYAPVGRPVNITCKTRSALSAAFRWFFNDGQIFNDTQYRVWSTGPLSVLTILKPSFSGSGVIGCTATNEVGTTRTSSRFTVYDQASISMTQMKEIIKDGKQYMVFRCQYRVDDRAKEILDYFTISVRNGSIDNTTNDESFGIKRPAVVKLHSSAMQLQLAPDTYEVLDILVNCTCHVEYIVFKKALYVQATTTVKTAKMASTVSAPVKSTGFTPVSIFDALQWWKILVVVVLLLIVIALAAMVSLTLAKMKEMAPAKVSVTAADPGATKPSAGKTSTNKHCLPLSTDEPKTTRLRPSLGNCSTDTQFQPLTTGDLKVTKCSLDIRSSKRRALQLITDEPEATKLSIGKNPNEKQSLSLIAAKHRATDRSQKKSTANKIKHKNPSKQSRSLITAKPSVGKSSTNGQSQSQSSDETKTARQLLPRLGKSSKSKQSQPLIAKEFKATKPSLRKSSTDRKVCREESLTNKTRKSKKQSRPLKTSVPKVTEPIIGKI